MRKGPVLLRFSQFQGSAEAKGEAPRQRLRPWISSIFQQDPGASKSPPKAPRGHRAVVAL